MGGAVGTVHMSGQLQARKAAIEDTFEKYKDLPGITRSSVAEAYDASTLAATDRILDELGKDTVDALGVSVNERAEQIQKAIDKAQGRDTVNTPDQVEATNRKNMASAQARLDALDKQVAEGAVLTDKEKAQKTRLEQRVARLRDRVAAGGNTVVSSVGMLQDIRNTFAGGRKFQIKEIGQVHEAFRNMLRGTKLSLRATKGVLRCRIVVHGRSAHSSKPHLGVNAITHMARVIAAIEADNVRMAALQHPLVGCGTCNVGVITGGVQVNFVPDRCAIEIDRSLLPGQRASDAVAHYRQLLQSLEGITAEVEEPLLLVDEALDTPAESAVVTTATQVLRDMGLNAEPCGVPFGCDASKLSRAGIPSIVFGPGSIDRAHTADEYVEIDQVETALEFQRRFLLGFLH
jgi:hypothetical protein